MSDKEKLIKVAEAANRYDLAALLELVCHFARPDEVRRQLTECYFTIARQLSYSGEGAGRAMGEALSTLSLIIEALDKTTPTNEPPLLVEVGRE